MKATPRVTLHARSPRVAELVDACARGEIKFADLCDQVSALGYRTTVLHEMVVLAKRDLEQP
jgi:hypothetical protein